MSNVRIVRGIDTRTHEKKVQCDSWFVVLLIVKELDEDEWDVSETFVTGLGVLDRPLLRCFALFCFTILCFHHPM